MGKRSKADYLYRSGRKRAISFSTPKAALFSLQPVIAERRRIINAEQKIFYFWDSNGHCTGATNNDLSFGYIPFDKSDKEAGIMNSVNGSGYTNSDINLDYISIMNPFEIEEPLEQ
ncbi:hypothetical protein ABES02_07595 [Neobacillus pocheonensis]|uniref:hypothetical protein n=1 Tax=Neobacillus pocheonensis TaxID=363869 RepID=UPI003D2DC310